MESQEKKFDSLINFLGILLILIGVYRFFQVTYISNDFPRFFWLCNISPLIIGTAILFRNSFVLIGSFSALFFAQTFWTIDLISFAFTGKFIFNTAVYIINEVFLAKIGTILVHILTLPLTFISMILIGKENKNAWKFSFLLFGALLPFIIYFGKEYNINLLYKHNFQSLPQIPLHPVIFPLLYIFLIVLPLNIISNKIIRKTRLTKK